MYLYTFFNFGARIGGYPSPRPGRFITKKETRYPLFWTLNGSLGPSGVHLFFLNFGTRIGGWSMPRPGRLFSNKETRYPLYWTLNGPLGRNGVPKYSHISTLVKVGSQCNNPANLPPRKRPVPHCIGRLMGHWAEAVFLYSFLTSALNMWLANATARPPTIQERGCTHCIGRSMGLWPDRRTSTLSLTSALE